MFSGCGEIEYFSKLFSVCEEIEIFRQVFPGCREIELFQTSFFVGVERLNIRENNPQCEMKKNTKSGAV